MKSNTRQLTWIHCAILFLSIVPMNNAFSQCFEVVKSSMIRASKDGDVIENKHIQVNNSHGIVVEGFKNVIIRKCKIEYTGEFNGIHFRNAPNLLIEDCEVIYTKAPRKGAHKSANRDCISGYKSDNAVVRRVKMSDGSAGIRFMKSVNPVLQFIEGYNFRGPFPRGQLVQFDRCKKGKLEDFYVKCDNKIAWTEDNINFYMSGGQEVRRGVIDGNNAPNGVGILWEDQNDPTSVGVYGGLAEDIDIINVSNGAATGADGSRNIVFRRVRVRDTKCELEQGRGVPSSGSLVFSGYGEPGNFSKNLKIEDCTVYNLCRPGAHFWPDESFAKTDIKVEDFTVRKPFKNNFVWCSPGASVASVGTSSAPVTSNRKLSKLEKLQERIVPITDANNPVKASSFILEVLSTMDCEGAKIIDASEKTVKKIKDHVEGSAIDISFLPPGKYYLVTESSDKMYEFEKI